MAPSFFARLRRHAASIDSIIRADRIFPGALGDGLGLLAFILLASALIGGDV